MIGRGSTILIHEVTFEDEMLAQAEVMRHSTIEGAVGIARDMDAADVILTHLSQRYPRLIIVGSGSVASDGPAMVIAFDCMRMRVRDCRV